MPEVRPAYTRLDVEERRRRLLELGTELFARHEYSALSMSAIAREAGISKALLYHYFPSKQAYFVATLEEKAAELAGRIAPDPALAPAEQLAAGLDVFLRWVEENGDGYAKLVRSAGAVPEVREVMEEVRGATAGLIFAGLPGPPTRSAARRCARGCGSWTARSSTGSSTAISRARSCTRCFCGRSRARWASRSSLSRVPNLLSRLAVDVTPLRESRDLRLLVLGNVVSGLGTQAALVALPYQIYVETGSAFLTGLLGAVELIPLVAMALLGGALADRQDRRRLLLLDQIALVLVAAALAALTFAGSPSIPLLYLLGGLTAGFGAIQNVTRSAIVPNLVDPPRLRSALALNFGLMQVTMVVGPAVGGLLIAASGVGTAYAVDAVSCLAMVAAAAMMSPQPPQGDGTPPASVLRSIGEGLRFVRRNRALTGSFAIDLMAMTFGMPRALFPVLAVSVYHAGAAGTGLLFAAVSVGATVAALTTGWLAHARRLGLIVIWAVAIWARRSRWPG